MKVLFVVSGMSFGGAERVVSIVSNELSRRGHQVGIYMTNASKGCVYPLDKEVSLYSEDELSGVKGIVKKLRKFVLKYKPDIVVPFMTYQCIYACFALAFTKYPVVVCERNDPNRIDGKNAGKLHFLLRDIAFNLAKGAVFQSEGAKAYFPKKIQKKSTVIMNPIDPSNIKKDERAERDNKIVTVGRLVDQKNHVLLLKAFEKINLEYPQFTLDIYGDGPNKEKLLNLSEELNISHKVRFMGNVSNVDECIKNASVFAFTSDFEGMPNALAEAMMLGLPCVSTDCSPGAARMLINDQFNGLIVPCNDVEALACAFRKLLSDRAYSESLGDNAKYVSELLDLDVIVSQWESYLSSKLSIKVKI